MLSCTQNQSPSVSGREALASGDEPLDILQINIVCRKEESC